jgi:hypothetical protein
LKLILIETLEVVAVVAMISMVSVVELSDNDKAVNPSQTRPSPNGHNSL